MTQTNKNLAKVKGTNNVHLYSIVFVCTIITENIFLKGKGNRIKNIFSRSGVIENGLLQY